MSRSRTSAILRALMATLAALAVPACGDGDAGAKDVRAADPVPHRGPEATAGALPLVTPRDREPRAYAGNTGRGPGGAGGVSGGFVDLATAGEDRAPPPICAWQPATDGDAPAKPPLPNRGGARGLVESEDRDAVGVDGSAPDREP